MGAMSGVHWMIPPVLLPVKPHPGPVPSQAASAANENGTKANATIQRIGKLLRKPSCPKYAHWGALQASHRLSAIAPRISSVAVRAFDDLSAAVPCAPYEI